MREMYFCSCIFFFLLLELINCIIIKKNIRRACHHIQTLHFINYIWQVILGRYEATHLRPVPSKTGCPRKWIFNIFFIFSATLTFLFIIHMIFTGHPDEDVENPLKSKCLSWSHKKSSGWTFWFERMLRAF